MRAAKIREPEQLYTPELDFQELADLIRAHLTPEGGRAFATEVLEAIALAKKEGDLGYVNRVVEAWVRTFVVINEAGFDDAWDHAQAADSPSLTLEEIKERLKLTG